MITELDYLIGIYELLEKLIPLANLLTGFLQFIIIVFSVYILYKLFNLFF